MVELELTRNRVATDRGSQCVSPVDVGRVVQKGLALLMVLYGFLFAVFACFRVFVYMFVARERRVRRA